MMVPDSGLISEIILLSDGFQNAKIISQKLVQCFSLCKMMFSNQKHYDFGMRTLKAILVRSGYILHKTQKEESLVLI